MCGLDENLYHHLKIFGMQNLNGFNIHMIDLRLSRPSICIDVVHKPELVSSAPHRVLGHQSRQSRQSPPHRAWYLRVLSNCHAPQRTALPFKSSATGGRGHFSFQIVRTVANDKKPFEKRRKERNSFQVGQSKKMSWS